jgi:hypothetical protein
MARSTGKGPSPDCKSGPVPCSRQIVGVFERLVRSQRICPRRTSADAKSDSSNSRRALLGILAASYDSMSLLTSVWSFRFPCGETELAHAYFAAGCYRMRSAPSMALAALSAMMILPQGCRLDRPGLQRVGNRWSTHPSDLSKVARRPRSQGHFSSESPDIDHDPRDPA